MSSTFSFFLKDIDTPFQRARIVVADVAHSERRDPHEVLFLQHKVLEVLGDTARRHRLGNHRSATLGSPGDAVR